MSHDAVSRPWGRVAAILTASAATLIGVFIGLEPEIILWRAAGASLAVGIVAAVSHSLICQVAKEE
jgi:hypothetical protein